MNFVLAAAIAHQLFRLDCYLPNQGFYYRYVPIQPSLEPSRMVKNPVLMQNLVLESKKSITLDEHCKIVATAELFPRDSGNEGDVFIHSDSYKALSASDRNALMSDAQSLDFVTDAQSETQIMALREVYRTEVRPRALDDRAKSRVPSDAAQTPNPR